MFGKRRKPVLEGCYPMPPENTTMLTNTRPETAAYLAVLATQLLGKGNTITLTEVQSHPVSRRSMDVSFCAISVHSLAPYKHVGLFTRTIGGSTEYEGYVYLHSRDEWHTFLDVYLEDAAKHQRLATFGIPLSEPLLSRYRPNRVPNIYSYNTARNRTHMR